MEHCARPPYGELKLVTYLSLSAASVTPSSKGHLCSNHSSKPHSGPTPHLSLSQYLAPFFAPQKQPVQQL